VLHQVLQSHLPDLLSSQLVRHIQYLQNIEPV
jgi:hypothetical protein